MYSVAPESHLLLIIIIIFIIVGSFFFTIFFYVDLKKNKTVIFSISILLLSQGNYYRTIFEINFLKYIRMQKKRNTFDLEFLQIELFEDIRYQCTNLLH